MFELLSSYFYIINYSYLFFPYTADNYGTVGLLLGIILILFMVYISIYYFLEDLGKIVYRKYKGKKYINKLNDKYLFLYILKFLPLGLFIGSFMNGLNDNKKSDFKHIIFSYFLFIILGNVILYLVTYFEPIFILNSNWDLDYLNELIYPLVTFVILFIIGVSGTIGYFLGKKKTN